MESEGMECLDGAQCADNAIVAQRATDNAMSDYVAVDRRLRCLEMASAKFSGTAAIKTAGEYYDYITGKNERTPREQIHAALNRAGLA